MDESSSRFRMPKTFDEEKECVINSIPKSAVYKKKCALQIFREWQDQRANKTCTIEPSVMFKGEDIGLDVQELTESIEIMNAKSLNYWLSKLVQEVADKSGGRYPSRTLYNIVCGFKRSLVNFLVCVRCCLLQINLLMSHDSRISGHCIQIFKDFHPVFLWGIPKHMHVMWYTCSDL